MNINYKLLSLTVTIFALALFFLQSFVEPASTHFLPVGGVCEDLPPNEPVPSYLLGVAPEGFVDIDDFHANRDDPFIYTGILVVVKADFEDELSLPRSDSQARANLINERVNLYLNGVEVPFPSAMGDELESFGPFYIHWAPILETGLYISTVQVEIEKGTILEYTWQFCITDK